MPTKIDSMSSVRVSLLVGGGVDVSDAMVSARQFLCTSSLTLKIFSVSSCCQALSRPVRRRRFISQNVPNLSQFCIDSIMERGLCTHKKAETRQLSITKESVKRRFDKLLGW